MMNGLKGNPTPRGSRRSPARRGLEEVHCVPPSLLASCESGSEGQGRSRSRGGQRAEFLVCLLCHFTVIARDCPPAPSTASKNGETRTPSVTLLIPLGGSSMLLYRFPTSMSFLTPSVDTLGSSGEAWLGENILLHQITFSFFP